MSNEYKDWISDQKVQFDINTASFNNLPNGWVNSFVPQLKDELFNTLGGFAEDFVVTQCKEKYASMVIYWSWRERNYTVDELMCLNELYDSVECVINKYSKISHNTCVVCGDIAKEYSKCWVLPFCSYCFKNGAY